ncbi:MAG: hypothetical protein UV51_C0007G0029 [Candidatus Woesebacteria bacterium GW2011_GWC1_42_9]|nr:MAG: hypothetical protein UV51_C0007G0029 [Candidatus Woesebacteria bacterium GW2011_GWC1_42_9]
MLYQVDREFKNQTIRIPVRVFGSARMVARAYHPRRQYTVYFDTAPIINGSDTFIIKIPKMPSAVLIDIYNERNGNVDNDGTFAIGKVTSAPIRQSFAISKIMNPNVESFAEFSDEFAELAGGLSAQNSVYISPDGKFRIDYKDTIRDEKGNELKTPARINAKSGLIEISKKYYRTFTVPGRKAINWHEFSHIWLNKNPADEIEADKNAIMIYLGTGNPTIEAYNVFLRVFNNTPSNINRKRYDELNNFIKNFNSIVNKQIKNQ